VKVFRRFDPVAEGTSQMQLCAGAQLTPTILGCTVVVQLAGAGAAEGSPELLYRLQADCQISGQLSQRVEFYLFRVPRSHIVSRLSSNLGKSSVLHKAPLANSALL
jgi:hypothetical protein